MYKQIILYVGIATFSLFNAVISTAIAKTNNEASKELKALASMLPNTCHFSGSFQQAKQLKSLPVPLKSSGDFIYSCEYGLIWQTKQPIVESLVFTRDNFHYLITEEEGTEPLEGAQYEFMAKLLIGLMAADTQFIDKEFDVVLLPKLSSHHTIKLTPKGRFVKKAIKSVSLSQKEDASFTVAITNKDQQVTTIESKQLKQFAKIEMLKKHCVTQFTHNQKEACKLLTDSSRFPLAEVD